METDFQNTKAAPVLAQVSANAYGETLFRRKKFVRFSEHTHLSDIALGDQESEPSGHKPAHGLASGLRP